MNVCSKKYFGPCKGEKLKSVENTVKHLKMPNICSNFIRTGVGPAKDKSPRKGTAKNAVVLLKVSMYI